MKRDVRQLQTVDVMQRRFQILIDVVIIIVEHDMISVGLMHRLDRDW